MVDVVAIFSIAWGIILLITLLSDIAAYSRSDQATITATNRYLVDGQHKFRNGIIGIIVGGVLVWASGWYETPPSELIGFIAWWIVSVSMFALMIIHAVDLILLGIRRCRPQTRLLTDLIAKWLGVDGATVRQMVFSVAIGGLFIHIFL